MTPMVKNGMTMPNVSRTRAKVSSGLWFPNAMLMSGAAKVYVLPNAERSTTDPVTAGVSFKALQAPQATRRQARTDPARMLIGTTHSGWIGVETRLANMIAGSASSMSGAGRSR